MKKIGFIDYFLDEWHANNYPKFIKDAVGDEFVVAYAYGEIDSPNGKTNREWADSFGVELLGTIDEVIEKSDVLIVLSPDHPERHWDLCQKPFRSGKRVYVDKTFAPSKKIAEDLVKLADENNTPFFSSSALRFRASISFRWRAMASSSAAPVRGAARSKACSSRAAFAARRSMAAKSGAAWRSVPGGCFPMASKSMTGTSALGRASSREAPREGAAGRPGAVRR